MLPAWRDSIAFSNMIAEWNYEAPSAQNHDLKEILAYSVPHAIEELIPESGDYGKEVVPWYQGDWKK